MSELISLIRGAFNFPKVIQLSSEERVEIKIHEVVHNKVAFEQQKADLEGEHIRLTGPVQQKTKVQHFVGQSEYNEQGGNDKQGNGYIGSPS